MNWPIINNPPFTDDLFTEQKIAAWQALKQAMPLGTRLTGSVYLQAPFGVFYDAGLGFPVRMNVPYFSKPRGSTIFSQDYPPLGSLLTGELAQFEDRSRQLVTVRHYSEVVTYEQLLGRPPDFRVTYRLFTPEEGGRKTAPHQGIRWDFRYENKAIHTGTWMIWPEFLDLNG